MRGVGHCLFFAEIVSRLKVTESRIKAQRCFGDYYHVKHYRFDMTSLSLGEKVSNLVFYAQSTTGKREKRKKKKATNSNECYYAKMYFTYESSEHVFLCPHKQMSYVFIRS